MNTNIPSKDANNARFEGIVICIRKRQQERHSMDTTCYYCGKPAVAGCDAAKHYNGTLVGDTMRISMEDPDAVKWCDRMMCEDHATTVGMTTKYGYVDTIDYCEKHRLKLAHGIRPEIKCK